MRATNHSKRKQSYFYDKNYYKIIVSGADVKQRLTLIVVLLRTEQFVYFLDWLIPLIAFVIFFSEDLAHGQNSSQDSYQDYVGPPCTQQYAKKGWSL